MRKEEEEEQEQEEEEDRWTKKTMLDEMQEEEENKCKEKRWTKKRMLDEMQEEEEEEKCRLRKNENTTKLSYRSSEGRSSSRRSSKCQNYVEKTPEIMRNTNILSNIST